MPILITLQYLQRALSSELGYVACKPKHFETDAASAYFIWLLCDERLDRLCLFR